MIKFFRKIRQRLLSESKFSRYLLYATGEIVLVVIGILLALQINTWNVEHGNRLQERQILKQLSIEYKENLNEIEAKNYLRSGMMAAIDKIFYHIDNGIGDYSLDSLHMQINRTGTTPTFNVSSGVTDELLSSGKLYLIQNADLKNHLTNFSTYTSYVVEEEQFLLDYVLRYYLQYLTNTYRRRDMMGTRGMNKAFRSTYSLTDESGSEPTVSEADYDIQGTLDQGAFERFLSDPIIENHLLSIRSYCRMGNLQGKGLAEKIELILSIIDSELENKKEQ